MPKADVAGRIRLILVAFVAAVVFCAACPDAHAQAGPPVPDLRWTPSTSASQAGFQCAYAKVPFDYADPTGLSITLSVVRHEPGDPAHRIGTLFMNPGGPGGPGTVDLPAWLSLFSPTMVARFDLVSWDPRGIGDSTAVQCFATEADETAFFAGVPQDGFPVGAAEKEKWIGRFRAYGRKCLQRNGALLSHTSTADTARDMDLLRRAVGARMLNYIGTSYGTFLGAVYANLFPQTVRAMILDGNLTPSLYTNNGNPDVELSSALRFGSDQGISESLSAFLDLCGQVGPAKCAFSAGSAQQTRAKFDDLLQQLKTKPVVIGNPTVTYAILLKALEGKFFTTLPEPGDFGG